MKTKKPFQKFAISLKIHKKQTDSGENTHEIVYFFIWIDPMISFGCTEVNQNHKKHVNTFRETKINAYFV